MKISVIKIIVVAIIIGVVVEGISIYRSLNYWGPKTHSQLESTPSAAPFLKLTLQDLKEHPQALSQWPGKTLVINFWATWCEPCKEEMPMLSQLQNNFRSKQVQFIGIGVDDPKDLKAWLQTRQISYPIFVGNDSTLEMTRALGNEQQGIPFTMVVSPSGSIVYKKLGKVKEEEMKQLLQQYIAS
ncbi:MAG: TlpA family protein disulfide reductase [Betaproteobacteria bacterium]|nr:TlpA family protein disulfide reductase [Betaproteobacteria bacterium]MDE2424118.1 TlpA family protein disulfide reductase [Betaproteobacteria bacterium]